MTLPLPLWRLVALALLVLTPAAAEERPPVVLVNGFSVGALATGQCEIDEDSTSTFGRLEELLRADGADVIFFDNCRYGTPAIERLGEELGRVIADLDAAAVDVVGFSMGGMIIRSYLSGKAPGGGFAPPADPKVRKAVLVATPNFGSPLANSITSGEQGPQLREASEFTWELGRWRQGWDDLRGVDAIAIVGSGGRGGRGDGAVGIHSAAIASFFGQHQDPQRTRVLDACHNALALLVCDTLNMLFGVDSADHPTGRIIRSFLAGTDEWRSVGQPIDEYDETAGLGDVVVRLEGSDGQPVTSANGAVLEAAGRAPVTLESAPGGIFHARDLPAGEYEATITAGGQEFSEEVVLEANRTTTALLKPSPEIAAVWPAAGAPPRLGVAPGSLISLYGAGLAETEAAAAALPLPIDLGGARVLANGEPLGLLYVNPQQINAHLPEGLTGRVELRVETAQGVHSLGILVEEAAPAVFTLSGGAAAALDATTFASLGPDRRAVRLGLASLYVTGLGEAAETAEVLLDGQPQRVLYAGPAPGFAGLEQINFEVGQESASGERKLEVRAGGRLSNAAAFWVQE